MKTKFWHVVTERPMKVGQEILFDEKNANGVATRINRVIELEKMSNTYSSDVEGFDKVVLDNFSHWKYVANREVALENIRKSLFANYPSRLSCLYVSTTLQEAEKWAEYFIKAGRETYQIVEVETNGKSFTGDANNCWYECTSNKEAKEKAIHYWKNGENVKDERPVCETIIDG